MTSLATEDETSPYSSTSVPGADSLPTTGLSDVDVNNASGPGSNDTPPPIVARKIRAKTEQGQILQITVSDPVKQGDGIKAFISYKVNTKTDLPEFDMSQFSVIRRYSDFVWLFNQLSRDFKGYIVPPLPGKNVMNRFTPGFIETRRRGIEKCLNRIARHDTLRGSDHFKAFLEAKDDSFHIQKSAASDEAKSKKKSFFSWITDTAASTYNNVRGSVKRERTPDDVRFDEISEYVSQLEPQLLSVAKCTTAMVGREQDLGASLFDFGLAFTLMGQCESGASLQAGLTKLGHTADSLSVQTKETADREKERFEEQLKDYIRVVGSVKLAMKRRNEALNDLMLAISNHAGKVEAHQALVGQPGKEAKAQQAMDDVVVAQTKEDQAKKTFHVVQQILFKEFDRFRREKTEDFREIMLAYTKIRIEHCRAMEAEWNKLVPVLEAIEHDESGGYTSTANVGAAPDGDSI